MSEYVSLISIGHKIYNDKKMTDEFFANFESCSSLSSHLIDDALHFPALLVDLKISTDEKLLKKLRYLKELYGFEMVFSEHTIKVFRYSLIKIANMSNEQSGKKKEITQKIQKAFNEVIEYFKSCYKRDIEAFTLLCESM